MLTSVRLTRTDPQQILESPKSLPKPRQTPTSQRARHSQSMNPVRWARCATKYACRNKHLSITLTSCGLASALVDFLFAQLHTSLLQMHTGPWNSFSRGMTRTLERGIDKPAPPVNKLERDPEAAYSASRLSRGGTTQLFLHAHMRTEFRRAPQRITKMALLLARLRR